MRTQIWFEEPREIIAKELILEKTADENTHIRIARNEKGEIQVIYIDR